MKRQENFQKPTIMVVTISSDDIIKTSDKLASYDNDAKAIGGWFI